MKIEANLKKLPQFGLFSVTRKHEVGMNSNRLSARNGESVPKSCTYRPSHQESLLNLKISFVFKFKVFLHILLMYIFLKLKINSV